MFNQWYEEEEFDGEELIEEFVANDYEQSFFVQYLQNNLTNFNHNEAKKLFNHLSNGLSNIDNKKIQKTFVNVEVYQKYKYVLISGYIEEYSITNNIPFDLIKLCGFYYGYLFWPWPFKISSSFTKFNVTLEILKNNASLNLAKELYLKQCSLIPATRSILRLHIIGIHNDSLPLFTYLVDSYNRFRIELYIKRYTHYIRNDIKTKQMNHEIGIDSFIKHVCSSGFDALGLERGNGRYDDERIKFENLCIDSLEYITNWRHLGKSLIQFDKTMYKIYDNISDYESYISQCFVAINKYINTNNESMPFQIDVTIIPNDIRYADDFYGDTPIGLIDEIGDLECLLKSNKLNYTAHEYITSHKIYESIKQLLNNKTNQRCCIVIDRRDDDNDKLFVYKPPLNTFILETCTLKFVNLSLFNNSIKFMIPNFSPIGVKQEHLFSVSFHCMKKDDVRTYLFIEGFCTRFFITDFQIYLSNFFRYGLYNRDNKKYQNLLTDQRFNQFYAHFVNRKYVVTSEDERSNIIIKVEWKFGRYPEKCQQFIENEGKLFLRPEIQDKDGFVWTNRKVETYKLSGGMIKFEQGKKYEFKIKCSRPKKPQLQKERKIHTIIDGFGIEGEGYNKSVIYLFEEGNIYVDNDIYEEVSETEKWKYNDILQIKIDCTNKDWYISFWLNYIQKIQISNLLPIKRSMRYRPFIHSRTDNVKYEVLF